MFGGFFNFPCCSLFQGTEDRSQQNNRVQALRRLRQLIAIEGAHFVWHGLKFNCCIQTLKLVTIIYITKWSILNYHLLQKVVCPDFFWFRKHQIVLDVYGICLGGSQTAGGTGGLQSSTWADADTALFSKVWQETRGRSANWPKSWWLRSGAYSLIALSFKRLSPLSVQKKIMSPHCCRLLMSIYWSSLITVA